jgi:hypothetical protein
MQGNEGQKPQRSGSRPDIGRYHRERWIAERIKAQLLKDGHPEKCAICGAKGPLRVNHDTTGMVRGLLCVRCDRALGLFEGNPDLLRRAAEYQVRAPTRYVYGETVNLDLKRNPKRRKPGGR